MEAQQPLTVGSLFAGIGGFDLAAERAGMEVVWQSEYDKRASAVLDYHWPAVKNFGDIHGINTPPTVDVLTGGFPCQDYSVAGNRDGLAGDRGALWWEYHRLIDRIRPTWVLGENVPGLLSSRGGADFETIIRSLTECGYGVVWAVLDAQYFGVAQRRRRVFIVGHSGGNPRPEILALAEGMFGHPEPSREEGSNIASSLTRDFGKGGADDNSAQANHLIFHSSQTPISSTDIAHPLEQNSRASHSVYVPEKVNALRTRDHKGPAMDVAEPSLVAFNWQTGTDQLSPRSTYIDALSSGQVPAVAFAQNQRDEVRELGIAGVLAAEPGIKQQTYVTRPFVRRLTPLECERLQGFPDGWTDTPGNSDSQRYRQLGNAVAVPVVEWILRRIAAA